MRRRLLLLLFPPAVLVAGCGGGGDAPVSQPLCGTVPYPSNTGNVTPNPIIDSPQVWSFVSEPDLHPMKVTINLNTAQASSQPIFVDPFTFSSVATYGQPGALILDNGGVPLWFLPLSSPNLMIGDFRTQMLNGIPVLTFWQGTIATPPTYTNIPAGGAEPGGCYYIMDQAYRLVRTIIAGNGFDANFHEFVITPSNTAIFISSKVVPTDLSPFGGAKTGSVFDFAIQELDLKTGDLLFFWDALDHIPLTDSHENIFNASQSSNVWDPYHLNSLSLTDDPDDILVSGRNTWTIYKINKPTGNIIWQLGGKHSNFTIASRAEFSWQHDARWLPNNVISLFDDNCCETNTVPPGTPPSHGLLLQLRLTNMTAAVASEYYHDPALNVPSQGSTQILANGNVFVGWGSDPYYSEYTASGNNIDEPGLDTVYSAQMPGSNSSYRAYRNDWVGTPFYPPSIAAQSSGDQTIVYASWNGSTQTDSWQLFGGSSPNSLSPLVTVKKSAFETAISVPNGDLYFQVKALNAGGQIIGVSDVAEIH